MSKGQHDVDWSSSLLPSRFRGGLGDVNVAEYSPLEQFYVLVQVVQDTVLRSPYLYGCSMAMIWAHPSDLI